MKRFETKIRVQYYETDKMGIVHHSNYVRYLETARTELFRDKGYAYDDMEKSGIWMPVLSVSVDFKTPAATPDFAQHGNFFQVLSPPHTGNHEVPSFSM